MLKLIPVVICVWFGFVCSLQFNIAIRQNSTGVDYLTKLVLNEISNIESPHYGQFISVDEINELTKSSIDDIRQVRSWVDSTPEITCEFLSDMARCETNLTNLPDLSDSIEEFIDFIEVKRLRIRSPPSKRKIRTMDPGMITREVAERLYKFHSSQLANSSSVAAIEFLSYGGFSNSHLVTNQQLNGVEPNPIKPDHTIGKNEGTGDESELDVQVMYWGKPDAELWFEVATGWIFDWASDFVRRDVIPEVVSLSWGWSEADHCKIAGCNDPRKYIARTNVEFMKIVARGTTIVAASGDAGSPGRTNEGCESEKGRYSWTNINPIFPGGSPWVLSVGGTDLVNGPNEYNYTTPICKKFSCANGTIERAVNYNQTGWTSGAGFTLWDSRPQWQQNEVNSYLNSGIKLPANQFFNQDGRAYPDVSAVGHNCLIYADGYWGPIDGTSCSAPIFAGIVANLNAYQKSRNKPTVGFANPLIYRMAREHPQSFNDVLVGNSACTEITCCGTNFGFQATRGYDVVSGLGTPNVSEMKKFLSKY